MLVEIGLVPLELYMYGQEEIDEEQEPPVPDADENETVEEDQDDVDDGDKKLEAVSMEDVFDPDFSQGTMATTGNVTQSLTSTTSNVSHSITATTANVAQSTTVTTTANMAQSTTAATGNVAHSTSICGQSNTQLSAELASLSPQIIAEDTASREMLDENRNNVLEGPLLSPQVIETSCPIFYPIICIQQLTILLLIYTDDCR
jgi:hypothetical protein